MHFLEFGGDISHTGFPGGSDGKESVYDVGDPASTSGSGRSSGEGNGYPLQYSCLGNSMDRGTWLATVHGVAKIQTQLTQYLIHRSRVISVRLYIQILMDLQKK